MNGDKGRNQALDWLRLVAAFVVLTYHYLYYGPAESLIHSGLPTAVDPIPEARYAVIGVEIFFLISGYVIVMSAISRGPLEFLLARARRLYPAFWVCMSVTALVLLFLGSYRHFVVTLPNYLGNLTMMPSTIGARPMDGVYWTLNYEIRFYLFVALLLVFRLNRWLPHAFFAWSALMTFLTVAAPQIADQNYLGNYYLLFATGAMVSFIRHRTPGWGWAVGGLCLAVPAALIASARRALTREMPDLGIPWNPWIYVGIVLACIVVLVVVTNPHIANVPLPGASRAGGISYPLYLLHANVGYALMSTVFTWVPRSFSVVLIVGLMVVCAALVNEFIENRLGFMWKTLFNPWQWGKKWPSMDEPPQEIKV